MIRLEKATTMVMAINYQSHDESGGFEEYTDRGRGEPRLSNGGPVRRRKTYRLSSRKSTSRDGMHQRRNRRAGF